jgi:hypothetical protein
MAAFPPSLRRARVKSLVGSVVFLVSLFLARRILVEAGVLSPALALVFLACVVGIPLGGIVFLEGALEHESRDLRREIEGLRSELEELRRSALPAPPKDV